MALSTWREGERARDGAEERQRRAGERKAGHIPDHSPNRFSGLRVSMVCMELCSTRTMGRAACRGMFAEGAVVAAGVRGVVGICVLGGCVRFRRRRRDCVREIGCGLDDQAPGCYRATTHIEDWQSASRCGWVP